MNIIVQKKVIFLSYKQRKKMKLYRWLFEVCSIFLFSSCLVTLNPLFENNDYVRFDSILGKWATLDTNKNGRYWEFVKLKCEENPQCINYNLIYYEVEDGKIGDTVNFDIGIGKIGTFYFMDIYPERRNSSTEKNGIDEIINSFYKLHILKAYTIHKITMLQDTLLLLGINNDWYKKNVATGKIKLNSVSLDKGETEVITATTIKLKKFIKKISMNKEVFTDTLKLIKIK